MITVKFDLVGSWQVARQFFQDVTRGELQRSADSALRREALIWADEMRQGIHKQAPGGHAFPPLTPLTAAFKGNRKVLIRHRRLVNSIRSRRLRQMEYFVGIEDADTAKIARTHEFGQIIKIIISKKQENYFWARLRELAGNAKMSRMYKRLLKTSGVSMGGATPFYAEGATLIVIIRRRPFMKPVYDKESRLLPQRVLGHMLAHMLWRRGLGPRPPRGP